MTKGYVLCLACNEQEVPFTQDYCADCLKRKEVIDELEGNPALKATMISLRNEQQNQERRLDYRADYDPSPEQEIEMQELIERQTAQPAEKHPIGSFTHFLESIWFLDLFTPAQIAQFTPLERVVIDTVAIYTYKTKVGDNEDSLLSEHKELEVQVNAVNHLAIRTGLLDKPLSIWQYRKRRKAALLKAKAMGVSVSYSSIKNRLEVS
ncbi:MAG: hypothetical protein ABI947_01045 [Chloroflexota bacterium]